MWRDDNMNVEKPDFFLTCTELRYVFKTRSCYVQRVVDVGQMAGCLLSKIVPEICIFDEKNYKNIVADTVVFAPRFLGSSLNPINEWPIYVYVCKITAKEKMAPSIVSFTKEDLQIILWGTLFKTYKEAEADTAMYAKQINGSKEFI